MSSCRGFGLLASGTSRAGAGWLLFGGERLGGFMSGTLRDAAEGTQSCARLAGKSIAGCGLAGAERGAADIGIGVAGADDIEQEAVAIVV